MKKTYNEIDFIRCVLIAIVILVHIVHFGNSYPLLKTSLFTFFMPAFLLVTGYLVNIDKSPADFAKYIARIFVPYALMVTVFSIMSVYLPVRDGLEELSVPAVMEKIFVSSIGPYWFLYDMIVYGTAYYAVFTLGRRLSLPSRLSLFAVAIYLLSYLLPLPGYGDATLYFMGVLLRQNKADFQKVFRPTPFAILPFLFLLCQQSLWNKWLCVVLPFFLFSFLSWCYRYLPSSLEKSLGYVGRNTLPVYLFHPLFTMASKFYLVCFGFDSTGISYYLFTVVLSMVGCLCIAKLFDKCHISYFFATRRLLR